MLSSAHLLENCHVMEKNKYNNTDLFATFASSFDRDDGTTPFVPWLPDINTKCEPGKFRTEAFGYFIQQRLSLCVFLLNFHDTCKNKIIEDLQCASKANNDHSHFHQFNSIESTDEHQRSDVASWRPLCARLHI